MLKCCNDLTILTISRTNDPLYLVKTSKNLAFRRFRRPRSEGREFKVCLFFFLHQFSACKLIDFNALLKLCIVLVQDTKHITLKTYLLRKFK